MIDIKIGGVPEHFNLPWHLALEAGVPQRVGVALTWRDYPDGSGAMAAALRSGEIDAALLLTEGAVAGVANAGGFRIASLYTESSLIWGIHVPASSRFQSVAEIRGARYAISRLGSGSHLMAAVHARSQGWPVDTIELVTVRNLEGAIDAFATGAADVFFWEKFMTKPLVDDGRFRRVGEFVAPWPAFVVCVADGVGAPQRAALRKLLAAVLYEAETLAARPDAPATIGKRYSLEAADVAEWLRATRWARDVAIEPENLVQVTTALKNLRLVPAEFELDRALLSLD